ncbi:MAG: peptidylprolyl isomerase [Alphaproteobacteria bacterium]
MKKFFMVLFTCLFAFDAFAFKIKATVGDEIITDIDIAERKEILKNVFRMQASENEVLDALIEEKIKLISAQKENISVTADQIADGISYLENQNGMEQGSLLAFVREKGLSEASLISRIKADLAWVGFVGQSLREQPKITQKQINAQKNKIKKELMQGRYLLAEIFIPFDDNPTAAEQEAQTIFNRIVDGESFTDLALQYSKGKTASLMGDLGWVKAGEMEKAIDDVLPSMRTGQLSKPIKGKKGYTIILMRESQPPLDSDMQEIWQVSQLVVEKQTYPFIKENIEKAASSCMAFTQYAEQNGVEGSHSGAMPEMLAHRIPDDLKELLIDKKMGELTGPVDMGPYVVFVMKCGVRTASVLPDDETIKQQLFMQEMEKNADKILKKQREKILVKKK